MQLIDAEFKHFRGVQPVTELIIFSAELHEIASNAELFVVGVPTQLGLATQAQAKGVRFAMCGFTALRGATCLWALGAATASLPTSCEQSGGVQHVAVRDIASLHLERPQQCTKEGRSCRRC